MADSTYQPTVYRKQGGNVLVVASTGQIEVESGGGIQIDSGGAINVASGGSVVYASGAYSKTAVAAGTTTANLPAMGVSTLQKGTTATGANNYTMDAPIIGVQKFLNVLTADSSEHIIVAGNTNVTYDGGVGTKTKLKIILPGLISLVGITTAAWSVAGSTLQVTPTS